MNNQPFKQFAIFGTMRSGSNLLEQYLNQFDGLVSYGELFNKGFIGVPGRHEFLGISLAARDEDPEELVRAIRNATPGKTPGYRIFQAHDPRMLQQSLSDPECAKIILTRDPVDSFTSLQIARKTDQWMISDIAHRKTAKIHFNLEAYEKYKKARDDYYHKIFEALKLSGQPYFELDFSALGELEVINRLACFIAGCPPKSELSQPIKRQNPEGLAEKIENYKEIWKALDLPEHPAPVRMMAKPARAVGTDLSRIYFCKHRALAFAPVPAAPDAKVRRWLELHNGLPPENGFDQDRLKLWLKSKSTPVFFSVLHHPVRRAYTAFMQKIFSTKAGTYDKIRQKLVTQYGLMLPEGDISAYKPREMLEKSGYGVEEHRTSFKQFLVFVSGNLQGKTGIRQDGKWQLQSEILRRYRVLHPIHYIFTEETLATDLAYLENRLNLSPVLEPFREEVPGFIFGLSEIYDAETEALAQKAYAADYREFGFQAFNPEGMSG